MSVDDKRQDALQVLGLTDWQYRPDGPLGTRRQRHDNAQPALMSDSPVADSPAAATTSTIEVDAVAEETTAAPATSVSEHGAEVSPDEITRMDWQALEAHLQRQDHRGARQPVFGAGARQADILIVGEAPGASEDAEGMPFVGRSGQLLDRMLAAIDCSRERNVYITNICKFRPPDNRDPTPEEVAADWPILERQIDLMQPRLVVAVGRIAAQTLLDCKTSLGRLRGQMHRYPQRDLAVLVTYHPAFLLRSPARKADAWQDLRRIARHIATQDKEST